MKNFVHISLLCVIIFVVGCSSTATNNNDAVLAEEEEVAQTGDEDTQEQTGDEDTQEQTGNEDTQEQTGNEDTQEQTGNEDTQEQTGDEDTQEQVEVGAPEIDQPRSEQIMTDTAVQEALASTVSRSFEDIYAQYKNTVSESERRPLVIAHRGIWRYHPENSLSSIQAAIDRGVDIVEIDVQKTSDGKLVLMHDLTIDRTTTGSGTVSTMTLDEIKAVSLKQGQGGSGAAETRESVPTLEEALEVARGKIMVNLDKVWSYKDDAYAEVGGMGLVDHVIFKSSDSFSSINSWLASKDPRPNYVMVVEVTNSLHFSTANEFLSESNFYEDKPIPDAFEVIFNYYSDDHQNLLDSIIEKGSKVWLNVFDFLSHSAGHNDAASLKDLEDGWGWAIDTAGATLLQTDRPVQMLAYLNPPSPLLPEGWKNKDIGAIGAYGNAVYDGNSFFIRGSGRDIWDTSDEFHYVYKEIPEDAASEVSIVARVTSFAERDTLDLTATHEWAKAGLMIRQSLEANSQHVGLFRTKGYGLQFATRDSVGGATFDHNISASISNSVSGPIEYVKLTKRGTAFSAYYSSNGTDWTQLGSSITLGFEGSYYMGLAVSSHQDGYLNEVRFEEVNLTTADIATSVRVLQNGLDAYEGTEDAHIIEYLPYQDRNTGGFYLLEVATYWGGEDDEKHILMKFDDIDEYVPRNADILSAFVELYYLDSRFPKDKANPKKEIHLYKVTEYWSEGDGSASQAGTWTVENAGSGAHGGARVPGWVDGASVPANKNWVTWSNAPSVAANSEASHTIGTETGRWYRFPVTNLVVSWLRDGSTNYGLLLKEQSVSSDVGIKQFASSEYSERDKRPILRIEYSERDQ